MIADMDRWATPIIASILSSVLAAGGTAYIASAVNKDRISGLQVDLGRVEIIVSEMRDKAQNAQILQYRAEAIEKVIAEVRGRQELLVIDLQRMDNRLIRIEEKMERYVNGSAPPITRMK